MTSRRVRCVHDIEQVLSDGDVLLRLGAELMTEEWGVRHDPDRGRSEVLNGPDAALWKVGTDRQERRP